MDLKELRCDAVEWIHLAHVWLHSRAFFEHCNEPSDSIKFVVCLTKLSK
jgi:hypothetical protein